MDASINLCFFVWANPFFLMFLCLAEHMAVNIQMYVYQWNIMASSISLQIGDFINYCPVYMRIQHTTVSGSIRGPNHNVEVLENTSIKVH